MSAVNVDKIVSKWEAKEGKLSVKSVEDLDIRNNLAIMLENQSTKDLNGNDCFLTESEGAVNTTSLSNFGVADGTGNYGNSDAWKFRPVALALVRRTFPDLFANKVVGVQAMSTPVGLAYALRVVYAGTNGAVEAAWDNVDYFGGFTGSQTGTSGALQTNGVASAAYGGIYDTSATGASTSAGENWYFNTGSPEYPQLQLRIDQRAIEAKLRQLGASFSLVAAQDIRAMHGIDIEREMVNILNYETTAELDRELLMRLKTAAVNTAIGGEAAKLIDCTVGSTSSFGRWAGEGYMSVVASIVHQANQIAIKTRRGPGNFVVVSPDVASALQAAGHQFVNYTQNVKPNTTMAAVGKLNGTLDVYRDQYARSSYALVGFKGPSISDAGVIFSPYIMGVTNRAVDPKDFSPRVGVMARYSITDNLLGAGRYYRLLGYTNVSSIIPGA